MPTHFTGGTIQVPSYAGTLVAATATLVVPARARRGGVIIQILGADDVYIGGANTVTTTGANSGILLKGGQTPPTTFTEVITSGPIYAIAAGSDGTLTAREIR